MQEIKSVQTKNYIAKLLCNEIFSGAIKDGEELAQDLIAQKLGVSRMPVREALQLLEQDGFLKRLPNRHMRVNGVNCDGILHNFRLLSAVETEIAVMLLQNNKKIVINELKYKSKKIIAQIDLDSCAEEEIAFHTQISSQLEDRYIEQFHKKLLDGYFTYVLRHLPYNRAKAAQDLEIILKALQSRELDGLREKFDAYFIGIAQTMIEEVKL